MHAQIMHIVIVMHIARQSVREFLNCNNYTTSEETACNSVEGS